VSDGLQRLRALVCDAGGLLAETVGNGPQSSSGEPDHAAAAAAGARVKAHRDEVELAVSAVREGHELHYGRPRALLIDDPDLALLAGDRLYALGLERLAAVGDLTAIAELADIISLVAQAHAATDPQLAHAVWDAGAAAIGWGTAPAVEAAKAAARAGDPRAADALRDAARALSGATPTGPDA